MEIKWTRCFSCDKYRCKNYWEKKENPYARVFKSCGHNPINQETILKVKNKWQEVFWNKPFAYYHFSSRIQDQCLGDVGRRNILFSFSIVSIAISLIRLIGLMIYSVSRMTKQIMVHKIIGASYIDRLKLILGRQVSLIIMAVFVAIPTSYYVFYKWVNNYHYQVEFSPVLIFVVLMSFIVIALIIGLLISHKLVNSNPASLLRGEGE